ncbi:GDSL-type esterase/lipase family protein [Fictibacillus barbaricus]|uniref:Lysophospholipase L1-like esterase n=1 Tax=Fictibacillus barbaricus TaxID=182136 RepID=A0ABU1U427_9BACL|nr:GDSL-type esterase/lipase family protein [Fictibacillus barbaricus]MDR7074131.1 lysophospholipase L1-like esterase [Fictibacillus barbaricus]
MRKVSKKWLLSGAALAIILFIVFQVYGQTDESSGQEKNQPIKIVALGDSLTYGVGDPTRMGYIGVVRNNIRKQTGRNVILNNFGISGQRSDQLLHQLNNGVVIKALKQADYVFVFIGTNDFRRAAGWNFRQLPKEPILLGKEQLRKNLTTTLKIVRKNNSFAQIYVLGLYNPYFGEEYDPDAPNVIRGWNDTILDVSKESSLTKYISTYELYENIEKNMYFSDTLHPNRRGYLKMGNWVFKQWKP